MSASGLLVFVVLVQLSGSFAATPTRKNTSSADSDKIHGIAAARRRWRISQSVSLMQASLDDQERLHSRGVPRSHVQRKLSLLEQRSKDSSSLSVEHLRLVKDLHELRRHTNISELRDAGAHSRHQRRSSYLGSALLRKKGVAPVPVGDANAVKTPQTDANIEKPQHREIVSRRRRRSSGIGTEVMLQRTSPTFGQLSTWQLGVPESVAVAQQQIAPQKVQHKATDASLKSSPPSLLFDAIDGVSRNTKQTSSQSHHQSVLSDSTRDNRAAEASANKVNPGSSDHSSSNISSAPVVSSNFTGLMHASSKTSVAVLRPHIQEMDQTNPPATLSTRRLGYRGKRAAEKLSRSLQFDASDVSAHRSARQTDHLLFHTGYHLSERPATATSGNSSWGANTTASSVLAFLNVGGAGVAALPAKLLQRCLNTAQEMPVMICAAVALMVAIVGGVSLILMMGDPGGGRGSSEQHGRRSTFAARRSHHGARGPAGCSSSLSGHPGLSSTAQKTEASLAPIKMSTAKLEPQPAPVTQLDVSTGSSATQGPASDVGRTVEHLCPSLLVPAGMEFVFAVREVVTRGRQEDAFDIVDLKGSSLSRVVVTERNGRGLRPGIFIQTLMKQPLAVVHTEQVHAGTSRSPVICRPSGDLFGVLKKDDATGRYKLKHRSGYKLLTFHGDFQEKAINVVNMSGKLVCATERCVLDFDSHPHYQVRIAPHVDAGLVLCGLLGIDKLESRGVTGALPAPTAAAGRPSMPTHGAGGPAAGARSHG